MRFGSLCSGIEAASVAWKRINWEAAWFSEIEDFPSAVLSHHYPNIPNIPNYGDMTKLVERITQGNIECPEVVIAGKAECADSLRYKALGNSMVVPCIEWIGKRIELCTNHF